MKIAFVSFLVSAGVLAAQSVPRAADGKPDLSGTWQGFGVSITGEKGAPPLHPLPPTLRNLYSLLREPF